MKKLASIIELIRPGHWTKNLLVLAAIIFSRNYERADLWLLALLAMASFCLLSSGVYAFNDILDRKADAAHPRCRNRPIPSGRVSVAEAAVVGTVCLAAGLALAALPGRRLLSVGAAYLLLNVLYNASLRRAPILDVITIALGFVLRAFAGGVAIGVGVSAWLIVCTFMLCVFLGLIKRRSDIVSADASAANSARPTHAFYTAERLDHMLAVSAGLAVLTYTLYCLISPHSPGVGMVWTVPIVLYGMFRLYSLAVGVSPAGPVELIRRDPVMWLVAAAWIAVVLAVMQFSRLPQFNGWITQ